MTNEHERGVEAATDILLLRAHELSARELAERAIAAYIEAVGFDSAHNGAWPASKAKIRGGGLRKTRDV